MAPELTVSTAPAGMQRLRRRAADTLPLMSDDYCDLCDLPTSTCVHGMPPPPPPTTLSAKAPRESVRISRSPRTPRKAATSAAPPAPTRRAPRRWTPPADFAPHIISVLEAAGGELDSDDAFSALEARLGDDLLDGDRQLTPEGELRWRYAARRARQSLINEGVMSKGAPGMWSLA